MNAKLLSLLPAAAVALAGIQENDTASAEAERERAVAKEQELHAQALEWMPDGWSSERTGRFLVIHQDSPKHAEDFADQGEAVLAWLDERFPYIGPEKYVRAPVLRIAKDYDELEILRKDVGAKSWRGVDLDILVCRGNYGAASGEIDIVNQRVLQIWFQERDPDLYKWLPRWVAQGLRDMLADSRQKRGKLVFKEDDIDRRRIREAKRGDGLEPIQDLVRMGYEDFDQSGTAYAQSGVLIEFLVSKDASRNELTSDLLRCYLLNLGLVLEELRESKDLTERQILDQSYERTFRAWSEKDWEALEKTVQKRL